MFILRSVSGIASLVLVFSAGMVSSQDYPNKTIRIITAAAGGGADLIARQIAQGIAGPLGQPVIVENRPTGAIVGDVGAKAPPDGYTLIVAGSTLWIASLLRKTSYDVVRDFSPISLIVREVFTVAVHPSVPVKSIKELIALAKARPGDLNYSSSSTGGVQHLTVELFRSMAGINIVHVPYNGNVPAITALISGEVQITIGDPGLLAPHVKSGRLRALAVTSPQPSALTPGLPTVAASGLPGYEAGGITGIWAPAKTPGSIINRLNQEIVRVVNAADARDKLLNAGVEVVGNSPEQFAAFIRADIAKVNKVIKDAGIKVE